MTQLLNNDLRDRLGALEDRLRGLRAERGRLTKLFTAAKSAAQENETDATLGAALAAKESVQQVEQQIEAAQDDQVNLLRRLGDAEAGRAGFAFPGVNGWETAARQLSLTSGDLRVDVAAQSLLRPSAASPPQVPAGNGAVAPVSNRWLFPVFQAAPFGPSLGDVVATDYTVSFIQSELTGTLTGGSGVEREVDAVTEKATMTPTVTLATPKAKQYAAVLNAVPAKVFESQASLQALLQNELARQLARSFDAAVVAAIQAASPPHGSSGSDLIQKIRNALSAAHDLGSEPDVIGLTPANAASLDLSTDAGGYVFVPGTTSQAVAWRLAVREVPGLSAPTLVDTQKLGLLYTGEGSVLVDPYSSMTTNQVRVRAEVEATLHIRNVQQGAFAIA